MARLQLLTKSCTEGREHDKAHKDKSTRKQPGQDESRQHASRAQLLNTPFSWGLQSKPARVPPRGTNTRAQPHSPALEGAGLKWELLPAPQPHRRVREKIPPPAAEPLSSAAPHTTPFGLDTAVSSMSQVLRSSLWKGEEEEQR